MKSAAMGKTRHLRLYKVDDPAIKALALALGMKEASVIAELTRAAVEALEESELEPFTPMKFKHEPPAKKKNKLGVKDPFPIRPDEGVYLEEPNKKEKP